MGNPADCQIATSKVHGHNQTTLIKKSGLAAQCCGPPEWLAELYSNAGRVCFESPVSQL
jgi:hypothetical protein